jgi:LacI family transcriptional regulator
MRPTLRQIAQEIGVSTSLVSGVLNDRDGVWVSDTKRQLILDTARRLGYRPHEAARSLRSGKSRNVAFVYAPPHAARVSSPGGGSHHGAIEAMAESLARRDLDLIVKAYTSQTDLLSGMSEMARSQSCDAVVLWSPEPEGREQGLLLEDLGIPFVIKGRHEVENPGWYQADFDHERMMDEAVADLFEMGHTRIAYLGRSPDPGAGRALLAGYRAALGGRIGATPPESWMAMGHFSPTKAAERVDGWWSLPEHERPTACIVTAGAPGWHGLEIGLARHGVVLGDDPGRAPARGEADLATTLLYGQARAARISSMRELAHRATDELLIPLLDADEPADPILRYLPQMLPLPSLGLSRDAAP